MSAVNNRRNFLKHFFSVAGISLIPNSAAFASEALTPSKTVEFITHFPKSMTLEDYRQQKTDFENKDKVVTLTSVFKKTGKMLNEEFSFHGSYSVWRVTFKSEAFFQEWMTLTDELKSHSDTDRETAGFRLEIRQIA